MHTVVGESRGVRTVARRKPGRARAWVCWSGGTAVAAIVLMFCYLRVAGTTAVVSDGAGNALEAWDMLHGNVLLHGWWATDIPFLSISLPLLVAVEAVAGLRPEVIPVCAAITYVLLILVAGYTAKGRATGAQAVGRILLVVLIMLAPEPGAPVYILLGSPDHLATALPVLLMLMLLDRAPSRWWTPVAAGVLLTWALLYDPLALMIGVLPLAGVCLVRATIAARRPQAAAQSLRYSCALVAAAVLAMVAARVASILIRAAGGLQVNQMSGMFPLGALFTPRLSIRNTLGIFGADPGGSPYLFEAGPGGVPGHVRGGLEIGFAAVHLVGVAAVLLAVALAARSLFRSFGRPAAGQPDLVSDLLVAAVVINIALFFLLYRAPTLYFGEEIAPALPLGAALAGRQLGGPLTRTVLATSGRRRVIGWSAIAAVVSGYCAALGFAAAQPQLPPANAAVANWLVAHGLRSGLGGAWQSASIDLDSGGRVTVGKVAPDPRGRVVRYRWQEDMRLFDPAAHQANFVVVAPGKLPTAQEAITRFGAPARTYRFQAWTILVWHHNLLPRLDQIPADG